jgi:hypothetical protein
MRDNSLLYQRGVMAVERGSAIEGSRPGRQSEPRPSGSVCHAVWLKFVGLEHAHDITLLGDDALHGRRDMLRFPQPTCAAMAGPSLPVRFIQTNPIQMAAGVCFEVTHDSLRRNLRFHHSMHMIASHMGRQQIPATVHTYLLNRFQYGVATDLVQVIGRLIHALPRKGDTRGIPFQNRGSRYIVRGINGAGVTTVEVAAVANKGDQVSHGMEAPILTVPNGRGSARSTPRSPSNAPAPEAAEP